MITEQESAKTDTEVLMVGTNEDGIEIEVIEGEIRDVKMTAPLDEIETSLKGEMTEEDAEAQPRAA